VRGNKIKNKRRRLKMMQLFKKELIEYINNTFNEGDILLFNIKLKRNILKTKKNNLETKEDTLSIKESTYKNFYIYKMFDVNNTLLYIGRTVRLKDRMYNHFFNTNEVHNLAWKKDVFFIDILQLNNFKQMIKAEEDLIAKYKPIYNINFYTQDNKFKDTYIFKRYTKEDLLKEILSPKEVKSSDIMSKLEAIMKNKELQHLFIIDWIRENFYTPETSKDTLKHCYRNNRKDILKLCNENNFELVFKKGRGNKIFIEKIKGE
jgi:hypothetical protein